ncbi:helix-turn-helix domain containing protein [Streptomyces turgidiscabies]|uniref:helix-turn-helix domain-containing protein n=1 Tax=Streptomyces TaxID=1883 RepID=UPI000C202857|nr:MULTISPECIES: helix-turn-helix domain-containing protein [Streptomyces]MDX2548236.1 helix-turn-helix domain containing protein [Streptomyces sp. WI04-05B]MDX2590273.1 helix-turn-helix domain containing protein [Streptomyces sp. WI04-05A]MDX3500263.1 helix-turn-helix domain containing protein [Streptomyces turgidiscabies]
MRYADGGGLAAERRAAREGIRLEVGQMFARGARTADIAKELRVSERSVEQWRRNCDFQWSNDSAGGSHRGPPPELSPSRHRLLAGRPAHGPAAPAAGTGRRPWTRSLRRSCTARRTRRGAVRRARSRPPHR